MEEVKSYSFEEKEFRRMEELAEDIHNTTVVLKGFCESDSYSEDFQKILPVIKHLYRDSDTLNAMFGDCLQ